MRQLPKGEKANAAARKHIERQAARILHAMAYDRQTFKNRIGEHLGGAMLEFYKAQLAEKNGHTKWVAHWRTEVRTLLGRALVQALVHPVKGRWDRRKAVNEAIQEVRTVDLSYRNVATNQILRDFGVRRLKLPLDDQDSREFWSMALTQIEIGLSSV